MTRTVTITGTHSPEGTETINTDLSGDRAGTIEKYYRGRMDRYDYAGAADSIEFILKPVVQDWGCFPKCAGRLRCALMLLPNLNTITLSMDRDLSKKKRKKCKSFLLTEKYSTTYTLD